jgi:N-acetylglutamate synthase-like GNAT family acetyltransferase
MSNIRYIKDTKFEYSKEVKNGLRTYNKSQAGYREKDYRDFYVFEDGSLVGACHTKQASDWCKINGIYYKDIDSLKALMNDVRKFYRGNVEGLQFNTVLEQRKLDFKELNFVVQGELEDMPQGNKNVFLIDKEMELLKISGDYQLSSSSEPIPSYDSVLKGEIKKYRKSLEFSTEKTDIQFVVLDNDKFVGGIYGNFQFEYLFINILFVDKKYRGKRIASKLMHMIEEEALKQGVTNLYLTTFEFQALGFYKKKGYKVVMTIEDFPKGFAEYTLYKNI